MTEETRANKINTRYRDAVNASVTLFREGKDHAGLDALLHSVQDLETMIEGYQYTGQTCLPVDTILPVYRKLLECMRNQDITGMTDLLEYELCPLTAAGRCGERCE